MAAANIWADPTVKFLDSALKSGVFLREITIRLNQGVEKGKFPNLQKALWTTS